MGKRIIIGILSVLLILSLSACAKKKEIREEKKATEKAERTSPGIITSDMYGTDRACMACHEEHHGEWQFSMHRRSFEDAIFRKEYEMAFDEAGEDVAKFCEGCHVPIGRLSGEIPPIDGSKLSDIAKIGVQCDFCHTIAKAKEGRLGNASYVPVPGNMKWGPLKDPMSPLHLSEYNEFFTKSEFCGMCHDVYHPVNGLPLEQTYTEWKEGPYNTGDEKTTLTCQHCMMGFKSGKAALGSKDRPRIAKHYFVGANVAMAELAGKDGEEYKKIAEERLKAAAEIKIVSPASFKSGAENTVEVEVTNIGCGHYLPTGLTNLREAWIHLTVVDGAGRLVYQSGALGADGGIEEGAVVYRTVLGDKDGKPTDKVWEAAKILSDRRVPPKKTDKVSYKFNLPAGTGGPYTITAVLKYRSAPQPLIDKLFGAGVLMLPVTEMTSASATVQ